MNLHRVAPAVAGAVALAAFPLMAWAGPHDHGDHGKKFKAELDGYEEVPAINSDGGGRFRAQLNKAGDQIDYELSYQDTGSTVTQAHIHFAQKGVNGAIVVFLCSNLGNGPAGTQPCPAAPATITGTIVAANVLAQAAQGIAAGDFGALIDALRAGVAYANVHTTGFAGGEIRGQIKK